jgi:hypothetical protein
VKGTRLRFLTTIGEVDAARRDFDADCFCLPHTASGQRVDEPAGSGCSRKLWKLDMRGPPIITRNRSRGLRMRRFRE